MTRAYATTTPPPAGNHDGAADEDAHMTDDGDEIFDEKVRLDKEDGPPPVPTGWTMHHTEGTSFIYGRRLWMPPPPSSSSSSPSTWSGEAEARRGDAGDSSTQESRGKQQQRQEREVKPTPWAMERHFLRIQLTSRDASLDPECDVRGEHFPFSFFVQRVFPEEGEEGNGAGVTGRSSGEQGAAANSQDALHGDSFEEHTFYHNSIEARCDVVDGELIVDGLVYHGPPPPTSHPPSSSGTPQPRYTNPFGGYPGPNLDEVEEEVLDGIQSWLAERGVDDQLGEFVGQYSIWVEQAEYERWLQQLRDYVFAQLTAVDVAYDAKAYHLVALNTVAFHPSVKLFLFEEPAAAAASSSSTESPDARSTSSSPPAAAVLNKLRREKLLKNVAFMLAQRNNAVCHECRWETVSLLGELCRMESAHSGVPTSALGQLEAKLNNYAKENLEYLAQLPWFLPVIDSIIKAGGGTLDDDANGDASVAAAAAKKARQQGESSASAAASSSRSALKEKLMAREAGRNSRGGADSDNGNGPEAEEEDEDVVIALLDIRPANVEQARDLMFVDASTSMLHLIPSVARGCSDVCAQCQKRVPAASTSAAAPLLRCSSCKAVYYCSAECQKTHWTTVHRTPCRAYKERCDKILEQYYSTSTASGKKKGLKTSEVVILEVPLEPSLFFETRRYLYDHRDESFAHVDYSDYFMKYTVRGS
ncbi:MYND finger family protein [Leishmania donovani]|uniref:MYND finger family protein n=1 Tax=Leishmania donovani TaxID=5661 RepID=A0A504X8C1_LEIDO|nr:MYND finger family protein [Leishmania donovani]